jgi:lysozyme family protein
MCSPFQKALRVVLANEGGYVNDPDDPGGETYMGISARYHPEWEGWELVREGKFAQVEPMVEQFYFDRYWVPSGCEAIATSLNFCEDLVVAVFDTAVQHGVKRAVKHLQKAVNSVGGGDALVVDGLFGKKTLAALSCRSLWLLPLLPGLVLVFRACEYLQAIRKNHALAKYAGGWANRVEGLLK